MGSLDIREADHADLPAITEALRQEAYFADRLARQAEGHGRLLVAWQDGRVVGNVYLWLAPAEEARLRELLPRVPLLTHLEVVPERRDQGIGTRLVRAAEDRLRALGHRRVALGVNLGNDRAHHLYRRLGYAEWAHGELATTETVYHPDGKRESRPEICRILVKSLGPAG
ncbi:GNAT family N-acetyltransferase [Actinomadura sp. ATCC 31491]|uniref:GNAT family N-acetyltransferase n=1 Tax=Actinomadura luzonensis TaxID=2805427 RepID=A0ABT0GC34_9ACTN|nr:GNAT family N-acetyltransferase [Actinomadura luzonensis]MCK2221656.1 GNAT family N-acetyltransferase [Actinomadura luzonensis]